MAKHDIFLIDGIIDERIKQKYPSNDKGEVFEYLAAEQILKDYDLSHDQINEGCVDGHNDGGIDYIFFFINGQLVTDVASFPFPKNNSELEVFFITCKHADSFKLAPVDSIYASLSELIDFCIKTQDLKGEYNQEVLQKRDDFFYIYKHAAYAPENKLKISVIYACRGNKDELGENILARSGQVEHIVSKNFSSCEAQFSFWGSSEILTKYRKTKKYDIELPCDKIMAKGIHSVVLVKLNDYYKFITDEEGQLRRYLFDANVRDYMGLNRVNQDILETLSNPNSSDFWLLNNGVTILVTSLQPFGEFVNLRNIQIVNGLQTTLTVYNFFSLGGVDPNDRCILVKIIKSDDVEMRDSIIKATNNQTNVSLASLHATDKIQRDIEEILLRNGIYYERRVKFYENQGIDTNNIVSPLYVASAFVSLVMKLPYQGALLKQKFMNKQNQYQSVFSEKTDLKIWPQLACMMKKTDSYIETKRDCFRNKEKFLKYLRQILAFFVIAKKLRTYAFTVSDLINFDISSISTEDFDVIWMYIQSKLNDGKSTREIANKATFDEISLQLEGVSDVVILRNLKNPFTSANKHSLNPKFLDTVQTLLPPQPWEKGIHQKISQQLNCSPGKVRQAIDHLIKKGIFYNQINGILYDNNGLVKQISSVQT